MEPHLVDDLLEIARRGSTKAVFVAAPDELRQLEGDLRSSFEPDCRATFSMPEFLELVNPRASKGSALEFICARAGVSRQEVIAAGDAPNDVEMMRFAGLALAPENAFQEAIAAADALIPPPEQDGIAELVRRYF
jgi:HAD superfamily hydrolase (TIGR01484 family)